MFRFLTASCLALVFLLTAQAQTAAEKKQDLAFVLNSFLTSGSFKTSPRHTGGSLMQTLGGLRALQLLDDRKLLGKKQNVTRIKAFVMSHRDPKTGGFRDSPVAKSPNLLGTAFALMILNDLKELPPKVEAPALAFLADNATDADGAYFAALALHALGKKAANQKDMLEVLRRRSLPPKKDNKAKKALRDVIDTVNNAAGRLLLGEKLEDEEAILKTLESGQRRDGGWGLFLTSSDTTLTFRVVQVYTLLGKVPPRPDDVKALILSYREKGGGYSGAPRLGAQVFHTYEALQVLQWLPAKE
jgi:hypothetical protein